MLVTSTPGLGHLGPLTPIAGALQAAGHQVRWATAEESCGRVRAMGFEAVAAGMGVGERMALMAPRMPEIAALDPRERRAQLFAGFFADSAAPRMYSDLVPVFGSFRPDLVLHETAELAAAPLAAAHGVPHLTVAFSGALSPAVVALVLARMQPLWDAAGVPEAGVAELFGELYLHPFPPSFGQLPVHPGVRSIRPATMAGGETPVAPDWLAPLGASRPLVYLTAGTDISGTQAPWSAALEAIAALDVDAVATIGPLLDLSGLRVVPANVRVERFVPQPLLLDRASVVGSHGGAGSVLGAATHGVPQLLYPVAADQWDNADAVSRSGAGIVLEMAHRDAATIAAALQQLLHEPTARAAARMVADEVGLMPSAADHVAAIEALVDRS